MNLAFYSLIRPVVVELLTLQYANGVGEACGLWGKDAGCYFFLKKMLSSFVVLGNMLYLCS